MTDKRSVRALIARESTDGKTWIGSDAPPDATVKFDAENPYQTYDRDEHDGLKEVVIGFAELPLNTAVGTYYDFVAFYEDLKNRGHYVHIKPKYRDGYPSDNE